SLALMVASLARRGARLQVARLRLAPRRLLRAAALSLSWLPRSLAAARGSKSLGCASLHVASCAPPLSRSHYFLAPSPPRAAPSRSAAPRSTSPLARRRSLALMVASLARRGARLQVARLRLAPRRLLRAAALSLSLLPRSLAAARGSKSLGCASLHVASCAPPLSRSHGCLARSPRRAAPSRSAAPRSTSPLARRRSLALMVASLARRGARLQVARLRLAPRRLLRAAALSLSWLPRSLAAARGSKSLGCASLHVASCAP